MQLAFTVNTPPAMDVAIVCHVFLSLGIRSVLPISILPDVLSWCRFCEGNQHRPCCSGKRAYQVYFHSHSELSWCMWMAPVGLHHTSTPCTPLHLASATVWACVVKGGSIQYGRDHTG